MLSHFFKPSSAPFGLLARLCLLVTMSLLPSEALRAEFVESWSGMAMNRSIYQTDGAWVKFGSGDQKQPKENTAIVRQGDGRRFLSLLSNGHPTANARAYRNAELSITDSQNNKISIEMRYATPGVEGAERSNVNLSLNAKKGDSFDPDGGLSMGITTEDGELVFYFTFGNKKSSYISSKPAHIGLKPEAWYRFEVELTPSKGAAAFTVYEISNAEPVKVWSGDNTLLVPYAPELFYQVNLMVARPDRVETSRRSADFANLLITQ